MAELISKEFYDELKNCIQVLTSTLSIPPSSYALISDVEEEELSSSDNDAVIQEIYIPNMKLWKIVEYKNDVMIEVIIATGEGEVPSPEGVKDFKYDYKMFNKVRGCMTSLRGQDDNGRNRFDQPDFQKAVLHPVDDIYLNLMSTITNLNDAHGWTREEIADWLDTLDEQPVFYPRSTPTIQNSAKVVTLQPVVSQATVLRQR
jgi:hypothetical protein